MQLTTAAATAIDYAEETFICTCCNETYPVDECQYIGGNEICSDCISNQTAV